MKFTHLLFATLVAGTLLGGCKGKDGDPGPAGAVGPAGAQGPTGQNLTGTITGYVNPIDENGAPLPKSGVLVSLDGTTPAVTATTDAAGKYEFPGVRSGTYNLTYTRSGLAPFRRIGVGHVGGDQPTYLFTSTLTQVSTTTVTALSATPNTSNGTVTLTLSFSAPVPTTAFRFAVVASTNSTVSLANGGVLLFTSTANASSRTTHTASFIIGRATLTNAGFASGTTVSLAAFGSTSALVSYADPATGRFEYPTLNPTASPVATIVVP
jgi:hypothetical protein